MAFSTEERQRIVDVINERVPGGLRCPVCHTHVFTMADGPAVLIVRERNTLQDFDSGLPCVAVACNQCGNTLLLSLYKLGLGDLAKQRLQLEPPPIWFQGKARHE